jgi:hypothetical protein
MGKLLFGCAFRSPVAGAICDAVRKNRAIKGGAKVGLHFSALQTAQAMAGL